MRTEVLVAALEQEEQEDLVHCLPDEIVAVEVFRRGWLTSLDGTVVLSGPDQVEALPPKSAEAYRAAGNLLLQSLGLLPLEPARFSAPTTDDWADRPLEDLNLPVPAYNALRRWSTFDTVGELLAASPSELLALYNFGPRRLALVEEVLATRGLSLKR
jgi:hypothetical protein